MSEPTFNQSVEELKQAVHDLLDALGFYRVLGKIEAFLERLEGKV